MSAGLYTKSGFNTCFFYLHDYSMSLPALAKQPLSLAAIISILAVRPEWYQIRAQKVGRKVESSSQLIIRAIFIFLTPPSTVNSQSILDLRFEILDWSIDPTDKFGGSFIGYRFFISPRMNPGACILEAFGQLSTVNSQQSTLNSQLSTMISVQPESI
jgi:hypothetical protein